MGTVIVGNAPLRWTTELTAMATRAELLVAADGGANALARIGLRPRAVVGDLDSISAATRRWLGEACLLHRPDQDHTDLEKTLLYVFDELDPKQARRVDEMREDLDALALPGSAGVPEGTLSIPGSVQSARDCASRRQDPLVLGLDTTQISVLAALGGRVDHTIHNLGLLARYHLGRSLVLRGVCDETFAVTGEVELPSEAGETWSFWTFDPAVLVSLEGVRWPVSRQRLDPVSQPSTSNLALAEQVRVRAEGGALLVRRQLHRRAAELSVCR